MNFTEKDMELGIDGMGIVFYSPETVKNIPQGIDFLTQEYIAPDKVAEHIKKGDIVGFCTGSGGNYILKFREGYPEEKIDAEYPVSARLGIDVQDNEIHIVDLFWLSEWSTNCPPEQIVYLDKGFYHITLNTRKPDSGIWGDNQTIYVYLNRLQEMPKLAWTGVPQLFSD